MPLRATYVASASSNVDISARIRAYQMSVSQYAEQGSVAMSQLEVDDPEGGINITGLRHIVLTESSESSNQQRIGDFWTADRDIVRHESLRTGSARLWRVNMTDSNSIITRRIMRGSDANRPAETDVQRVQWLLGTSEFGGTITTSRYVSTRFPVAMDANDYRDQSNQQILDDCSQASGKNYFVFYDEPVAAFGLWYDFSGSSSYRSSIQLTNILGLVDNDISFGVVNESTKLNRDPSRVYSGVVMPFVGGEVYVQNDTTSTEFFKRDTTSPQVNVHSTAKATARANRYLTDIRTEADVITTAFIAPLAKVNHLQVGQAVQCWFSHFPGYETGWNWMRVLTRTITATSEEYYTVEVELAAGIGGLDNGPGSVPFPPVPIVSGGGGGAQSCLSAGGLRYDYTLGGTRSPLGLVSNGHGYSGFSTEFMQYANTFASNWTNYPQAGVEGDWQDGGVNLCVFPSGGVDYTSGGISKWVNFTIIGPGSLSVTFVANTIGACGATTQMDLVSFNADSGSVENSVSGGIGTLSITVPNDGHCGHYIRASGNGSWGFVSATWTPA